MFFGLAAAVIATATVSHAVEIDLSEQGGKKYYHLERSGLDRDSAEVQAVQALAFSKTVLDLNDAVASSASLRGALSDADIRSSGLITKPTMVYIPPLEKRRKQVVDSYVRQVQEVDIPVYRTIEVDAPFSAEIAE